MVPDANNALLAIFMCVFILATVINYATRSTEENTSAQPEPAEKHDKYDERTKIDQVIISIRELRQEFHRQSVEAISKETFNKFWKIAEVSGLWMAAIVGLIAIFVSNIDSDHQRDALSEQVKEMKIQRTAIERTSVSGRAYLFVSYVSPQAPVISGSDFSKIVNIKFNISNVGQTPAIITNITTHLLVSDQTMFFNSDSPPDPERESARYSEQHVGPIIGTTTGWIYLETNRRAVVPGNTTIPQVQATYIFERTLPVSGAHGSWLYFNITYRDVFSIERHTWFYAGIYGAGVVYPKDDTYNRWD